MATPSSVFKSYFHYSSVNSALPASYILHNLPELPSSLSRKSGLSDDKSGSFPQNPINPVLLPETWAVKFIIMLLKIIAPSFNPVVYSTILINLRFNLFSRFFNLLSVTFNYFVPLFQPEHLSVKPVSAAPIPAAKTVTSLIAVFPMMASGTG